MNPDPSLPAPSRQRRLAVRLFHGPRPVREETTAAPGVAGDEVAEMAQAGAPLAAKMAPEAGTGRAVPERGHATWPELLVVFVFSVGAAIAFFHAAWVHPLTTQVGPGGDADEYSWFLSWMPFALGHGLDPLVSTYVNSPHGVNLMWNTSVVLPSFLVSPLTVLFGAALSYNFLMTLAPALTCTFAYFAFRRWTGRLASLTGALVAGFSPYMFSQSNGHLAQTLILSAPLLLVLADRLFVVQSSRPWLDGLLLGILAWAQLLTGEEILAMEAVTAVIALVVLFALGYREVPSHFPYAWRGLGVAAVCFAVLSAPFLAVQFAGPYQVQNVHPPNVYVSDLFNFFVPTGVTKLGPGAASVAQKFTGNISEQGAYVGIPLIALLVVTLVLARRRRLTWVAAAAAAAAAIFSLGPTLHYGGRITHHNLPYYYLQKLPFFHNLLADRFASMMTVAVGLLVALGCNELRRSRRPQQVAGWALAGLGLAAIFPMTSFPAATSPTYLAFEGAVSCPGPSASPGRPPVALVVPAINEMNLRWQSEAGFCFLMPSDTGMTGTNLGDVKGEGMLLNLGKPGQALLPRTSAARAKAAREIARLGIKEIIVGPEYPAVPGWTPQGQANAVAWVGWLVGRPPQQVQGPFFSYVWDHLPPVGAIASGKVGPAPG
ncbi:MAG: hypothetical protein ACRDZX_05440 [Acidimicrobiales bacterium]